MQIGGRFSSWHVVLCALFLCAGSACNVNPFDLSQRDDAGVTDDGGDGDGDGDGDAGGDGDGDGDGDGGPDGDAGPNCVPSPEDCDDGVDNDCDDQVDEFNSMEDPSNCGGCGNRCFRPNSNETCVLGECVYPCSSGYHDLNDDVNQAVDSDGCEYYCLPTNGGTEACDLTDNDCDGAIDEDFGVDNDPLNCGGCGNACAFLNAIPTCTGGECGYTDCVDGYADLFPVPGCEYECPEWPPAATESCDNVDNDCDGEIDEDAVGGILGTSCTDLGFESIGDEGLCEFGAFTCLLGTPVCSNYVGPESEVCNNEDDDCDGDIDEAFDKQTDVHHCGASCTDCSLTNAIEACVAGQCEVAGCAAGWVNANGTHSDGCEYQCTPTGDELCDGRDNDCDGDTDENVTVPPTFSCNGNGACNGTTPECTDSPCSNIVTWRCLYGGNSEANNCGDIPLQETSCDTFDGDCDGAVDETFITLGDDCDDGEAGACLGTGAIECASDGNGVVCNITDPGLDPAGGESFCDNVDEDCDGNVDENAPDTMVGVDSTGDDVPDFWIDAYEASRPDADELSAGYADHRACSNADVVPWGSITYLEADLACQSAGKRLCSEAEWELACAGTAGDSFPYGNTYEADACNGNGFDSDCTVPDDDSVLATGYTYGCPAPLASCEQTEWAALAGNTVGTFDMSGNLKEWTSELAGAGARRIRGGSYDSIAAGLTCQFDFVSAAESYYFQNLGFRCCSDTAP